jgi:hypothetical protein
MFDVIVTRHRGLVDYLVKIGLATPTTAVVTHANAGVVRDKKVCGVLPHSLSCLTESFTEIPLALPLNKRGQELTAEEIEEYAGEPITYTVRKLN